MTRGLGYSGNIFFYLFILFLWFLVFFLFTIEIGDGDSLGCGR